MNFLILDTGYLSNVATANQVQLSDANRAGYDGSTAVTAFEVGIFNFNRARDVTIDNRKVLNATTEVTTNLISKQNPQFSFNIQLSRHVSNTGYETNFITQLLRLEETEGLKLLYVSSINDENKSLIEILGEKNKNGNFADAAATNDKGVVPQNIPYLIGRLKFGQIPDFQNRENIIIPVTWTSSN